MSWQKQTVGTTVPAAVQAVGNTADGISTSLDAVVSTITALLDAAKLFYSSVVDPFATLVIAVITEIETLLNDLFGTGFYQLIVTPMNVGHTKYDDLYIPILTPQQATDIAINSLDDEEDENRPQFSDQAEVSGLAFLLTAPSLDGLLSLLQSFLALFNIDELLKLLEKLQVSTTPAPSKKSKPPDWDSMSLKKISPYKDVYRSLTGLLSMFKGYITTADNAISDMIDIMDKKVNRLNSLNQEFKDLLDSIVNAVDANGVYVLDIPTSTGGNEYIKTQIPNTEFESMKQNKYTVMVLYIAGGAQGSPSIQGMETLKSLFGVGS